MVMKRTVKKRVVEVTRRMAQGSLKRAAVLLRRSGGGTMLNTAFIERFNGTMRERLSLAHAQVSSCTSSSGGLTRWHVSTGLHL